MRADPTADAAPARVVVDEWGRIREVAVSAAWRRTLPPRRLGPVLADAANAAWVEAALQAAARPPDPGPIHPGPIDTGPAGPAPGGPAGEPDDRLVADLLADATAATMAALSRARATALTERRGTGPEGRIEAVIADGRIAAVRVDLEWAVTSTPESLAAEALGALRAAWPPPAVGPAAPGFRRVAALVTGHPHGAVHPPGAGDPHAAGDPLTHRPRSGS